MPSGGRIAVILALNWRAHKNVKSQDLWGFVTHPLFVCDDTSVPGCGRPDDTIVVEWCIVNRKNYLRKWLWPNGRYCWSC